MQSILEWMAVALGREIFLVIGGVAAYLFFKERGAVISAGVISALVLLGVSMGMLVAHGIPSTDETVGELFLISVASVIPYFIAGYNADIIDKIYLYLFDDRSGFLRKLFIIPTIASLEFIALVVFGISISNYEIYTESFFWTVRGVFFWALFLFVALKIFDMLRSHQGATATGAILPSASEATDRKANSHSADEAGEGEAIEQDKNYYEILGVSTGAEPEVIRAAYKALILKYGGGDDENLNARSVEIDHAFSILSDSEKRKAYDDALG